MPQLRAGANHKYEGRILRKKNIQIAVWSSVDPLTNEDFSYADEDFSWDVTCFEFG